MIKISNPERVRQVANPFRWRAPRWKNGNFHEGAEQILDRAQPSCLAKQSRAFVSCMSCSLYPAEAARSIFISMLRVDYCFDEILRDKRPKGWCALKYTTGDWREVNGIRLPLSITQSMPKLNLEFTFEEVRHNVPLEEAVFHRP